MGYPSFSLFQCSKVIIFCTSCNALLEAPQQCHSRPVVLSLQSMHKQQQLQHQQFQRQMEEKLELLQRQQLVFQPPSDLPPDADFLDVARVRTESSNNSSPSLTPRASNHSNLSVPEQGSSALEPEDGGMARALTVLEEILESICILESRGKWSNIPLSLKSKLYTELMHPSFLLIH